MKMPTWLVFVSFLIDLPTSFTNTLASGTTASFSSTTVPSSVLVGEASTTKEVFLNSSRFCPLLIWMIDRSRQRDTKAIPSEALRDTGLTISALSGCAAMGVCGEFYDTYWSVYKNWPREIKAIEPSEAFDKT